MDTLLLLGIGAIAGVMAGLLGIGGGLIIVPALTFWSPLHGVDKADALHAAVATSLASISFTAMASAYSHYRRGAIEWRALGWLTPGLLIGSSLGALIVAQISRTALTWFVAAFCIFAAWQVISVRGAAVDAPRSTLPRRWLIPGGIGIGAVSAAVGIGGGSLTVPLLYRLGAPLRNAIATSAAAGLPIALAAVLGYAFADTPAGLSRWSIGLIDLKPALTIGCLSVVTAPMGAALAHRWPTDRLKRVFAIWLLLVAGLLFFGR